MSVQDQNEDKRKTDVTDESAPANDVPEERDESADDDYPAGGALTGEQEFAPDDKP
ncbi:MAG TPA: hypothetical protein VHK28_00230 [Candidatus Limnocylindria bacterium]|nr:hypothetical protein [Candidatus Limnocylindria bacterium]